jgi:tetratricopeptide (TPR) repeat protein
MKKLFQEMHARSLWQVVGIYLAGSWLVLQVVDQLTESAGLPAWVPSFALVLLLIGLPIVVATAFLQHRTPASGALAAADREAGVAPVSEDGAEPPTSGSADGPQGSAPRRLFTWRNAILGGVGAALLFGVVLAGWTYARNQGIGAAGTLVAKGVIDEGDRVILAEFSGDSAMAEVATMAFRVDLSQSPTINVADASFLRSTLQRMEVDPEARLDEELAREAAIREGLKAVVAGDVARAGGSYVVSARLVAAESGEDLVNLRETASDSSRVMEAIDQLSRRMRERLGESLGSIRASAPLDRATTTSLEALRKYSQALKAIDAGDHDLGTGLLEEAVQLDPEFAMAWRKLAVQEFDDVQARKAAATRAYELRDLLTDRERYMTMGTYHGYVTLDNDAAINAYRTLLEQYPEDAWALNNIALQYAEQGKLDLSNQHLERAIAADPYTPNAYINLAAGLHYLGHADSALAVLDRLEQVMPENPEVTDWRARFAAADWDYAKARRLADELMRTDRTELRRRALDLIAATDLAEGRLERAERSWLDARTDRDPLRHAAWRAWNELLVREDPRGAAAILDRALASGAEVDSAEGGSERAWLYALAGRPDEARLWLDADRRADNEYATLPAPLRAAQDAGFEAAVATGAGRHEAAVELLRQAEREMDSFFEGLGVREISWPLARAFDRAGMADSAIVRYEAALEHSDEIIDLAAQPRQIPTTYLRLAQLYEERGDLERASGYYGRFVDLWDEADPEFQPRVERARARLAAIVAERG